MKSKEAVKVLKGYLGIDAQIIIDALIPIAEDLQILEFIKTHYKMNGFNELIPLYLDYDDDKKFDELERWLENE